MSYRVKTKTEKQKQNNNKYLFSVKTNKNIDENIYLRINLLRNKLLLFEKNEKIIYSTAIQITVLDQVSNNFFNY